MKQLPPNPLRIMIFRHTGSVWVRHVNEDTGKPCLSRITLMEHEWKGAHENWTPFSFCLDCDALGVSDPLDSDETILARQCVLKNEHDTEKYHGHVTHQEIYAYHFGENELPSREKGGIDFAELLKNSPLK